MSIPLQSELFPRPSSLPSPEKMAQYREEDAAKRAKYEQCIVGTKAHLRRQEREYDVDQERVKNTCIVEYYEKGMGLRVERRKPGFPWKGTPRSKGMELIGHKEFTDEHGVVHPDTRAIAPSTKGGKRGRCKGATASAMARLRDKTCKVDRNAVPVFITLGWPKSQTPSPDEAKRCRDAFLHALIRKYPRAAGFWKLEFGEESGLPHYHIILWGAKPWKGWLSRTWYRICKTNNPDHLAAGTRIEKLRSYRGTLSYCGKKYMSKTGAAPEGYWGRSWGMFNKTKIPWDIPIRTEAPGRVGMWFARIQRRFIRAKYGRKNGGRGRVLWVNPEHASEWLRVLEWAETRPTPGISQLVECPF